MKTLEFSYNWNNKLMCDAFSTFRVLNPAKYAVGESYLILLMHKGEARELGIATLHHVTPIAFNQVTDGVALVDSGYFADEFKNILRRMYPGICPQNEMHDGNAKRFGMYFFKWTARKPGSVTLLLETRDGANGKLLQAWNEITSADQPVTAATPVQPELTPQPQA